MLRLIVPQASSAQIRTKLNTEKIPGQQNKERYVPRWPKGWAWDDRLLNVIGTDDPWER